jgi:hypothetical protein
MFVSPVWLPVKKFYCNSDLCSLQSSSKNNLVKHRLTKEPNSIACTIHSSSTFRVKSYGLINLELRSYKRVCRTHWTGDQSCYLKPIQCRCFTVGLRWIRRLIKFDGMSFGPLIPSTQKDECVKLASMNSQPCVYSGRCLLFTVLAVCWHCCRCTDCRPSVRSN